MFDRIRDQQFDGINSVHFSFQSNSAECNSNHTSFLSTPIDFFFVIRLMNEQQHTIRMLLR